ncbi:MAG: hypothetical protein P8H40_02405 [Winogradskyella sp.]|nr:hypothetical protein [Winogradskyella sp.]
MKNVTLSFKTTAEEQTALQQIANEKQISRSELLASLIHAYKHSYDYIGKISPREAELKLQLKNANKENRKLTIELENAENRIGFEQKANKKYVKEQLEMNRTIFNLQNQLKVANAKIKTLTMEVSNKNQHEEQNNYDNSLLYSSLGSLFLSGLTLFIMPKLFNN